MFEPVKKTSLSRKVFDQLQEQILRGRLKPGEDLPAERSLSDLLAVNRAAVREALKRLEQARLIRIQQGGTTRVLDYLRTAGMELLANLVLSSDGRLDTLAVRSLMEIRSALGPDLSRLCARRRTEEQVAEMDRIVSEMRGNDDIDELQELSFDLWQVVVLGSENIAYQLTFNSLRHAYGAVRSLMVHVVAEELRDIGGYEALVEAIRRSDEEGARAIAGQIVGIGEARMSELLSQLPSHRYVDIHPLIEELSHGSLG